MSDLSFYFLCILFLLFSLLSLSFVLLRSLSFFFRYLSPPSVSFSTLFLSISIFFLSFSILCFYSLCLRSLYLLSIFLRSCCILYSLLSSFSSMLFLLICTGHFLSHFSPFISPLYFIFLSCTLPH